MLQSTWNVLKYEYARVINIIPRRIKKQKTKLVFSLKSIRLFTVHLSGDYNNLLLYLYMRVGVNLNDDFVFVSATRGTVTIGKGLI